MKCAKKLVKLVAPTVKDGGSLYTLIDLAEVVMAEVWEGSDGVAWVDLTLRHAPARSFTLPAEQWWVFEHLWGDTTGRVIRTGPPPSRATPTKRDVGKWCQRRMFNAC